MAVNESEPFQEMEIRSVCVDIDFQLLGGDLGTPSQHELNVILNSSFLAELSDSFLCMYVMILKNEMSKKWKLENNSVF